MRTMQGPLHGALVGDAYGERHASKEVLTVIVGLGLFAPPRQIYMRVRLLLLQD
jgi:hypothetical protein